MKTRLSALLATLVLATAACQQKSTTPTATSSVEDMRADQIIYGLKHTMTSNGVRSAVLHGDTAYVQQDGRRFDLTGVQLEFFDSLGHASGNLTSKSGEYRVDTGDFTARGTVVLVIKDANGQRRLTTEELHFEPNSDQVWSPVPFVLVENGQTSRGKSFRSDSRFRNLSAQGLQGTVPGGMIQF